MNEALTFWGAHVLVAGLALPLSFRLFRRFPDGGAGLCFALGLLSVSVGYFLFRVTDIAPVGRGGYVLVICAFALAMTLLAARDHRFASTLRRSAPGIAGAAVTFSVLFTCYALFRAAVPDIGYIEQPMNLMLLNTMLISPEYPPHDPWFAGESVSYYYGGHLQMSVLTGLSGVPASVGFNLALGATFASAGTAVASLCAALARWLFGAQAGRWVTSAAAAGVVLLLLSGSLVGPFELAVAHRMAPDWILSALGLEVLIPCESIKEASCDGHAAPPTSHWYPDEFWFWWRSSRLIPDAATEPVSFAFLIGNLHAHTLAIPGVLLSIAVSAATYRGRGPLSWRDYRAQPVLLVAVALIFGSLPFVNAWNAVTFTSLLGAAVAARNFRAASGRRAALAAVSYLLPPAILAALALSPWLVDFESRTYGLYSYAGPGTSPRHAFLQFGAPLILSLSVIVYGFARRDSSQVSRRFMAGAVVPLTALGLWVFLAALRGALPVAFAARGDGGWITLVCYALAVWALSGCVLALGRRSHPAIPVAPLAALGALLLLGTELFFIRDILGSEIFPHLPRYNTVFKLTHQAWILLSIAGAVGAVAALRCAAPAVRPLVALPFSLLVAASLVLVVIAVPNRTQGFSTFHGLDGLAYVATFDPAEYALVQWLAENVPHDSIVVEASGRTWVRGDDGQALLSDDSHIEFTASGRIASRTGLQTPIGWPGHEFQWRAGRRLQETSAEIRRRQDLVDRVYTAATDADALHALRTLGASYVVVGREERANYQDGLLTQFGVFLETAFAQGDVRIFRVPSATAVPTE